MRNETVRNNVAENMIHVGQPRLHKIGAISELHYHDEIELLYVESGTLGCVCDGVVYEAKEGDVVFINSRVPHSTHVIDDAVIGLIQFKTSHFTPREIPSIIKYSVKFHGLSDMRIYVMHSEEMCGTLCELMKEIREQKTAYELYTKSLIYKLVALLHRNKILTNTDSIEDNPYVQKILPVLKYVNSNYFEDITLTEASNMLGFDPSYFCRIFRAAIGATFTEYLNFVRICKAEKLLASSEDSILEISEAVGFSSVSYFNRTFKKFKNCSPGYYRTAKYCSSM